MLKCRTAFGFALLGTGRFKGHVFLLFRGTQYLADWLTNFNIGVSRSRYGNPAHDGFNTAFKSIEPQLSQFMESVRASNIHSVHCIGHSLGGALATLCSEWVHSAFGIAPYLYTYGSPRVGLIGFAAMCTQKIGCDRIFRVYHKTDVVPCIPLWPFIHTPNIGKDYYLPSPGFLVGAEYHSMKHYITSVRGKEWNALGRQPERKSDEDIAKWLKTDTPVNMTSTVLEWLGHAINYVINKCASGVSWIISGAASASLTIMDQLAYIISTSVNLAETISSWVIFLMRKIMRLLGHQHIVDSADMTHEFVRGILRKLQQRVNQIAQSALSDALVNGRAI